MYGKRGPTPRYSALYLFACASLLALLSGSLYGQTGSIQVPADTPLSVQLVKHVPMKSGERLEGRLLYPVYVENRIAIPAGAILRGTVIELDSDRSRRVHARLRGDFTPFHTPVVRFDQLVLPDGAVEPIVSDSATNGVPILRLSPPPSKKKRSLISRQIQDEKQRVKDTAAQFTAPGRKDRLVQFIYTQLPYHPERIETGTAWTADLGQPLDLKLTPPQQEGAADPVKPAVKKDVSTGQPTVEKTEWQLRAYLQQTISSADEKPGDTFQAVVSEPVFDAEHSLEVPQGALLIGEITQTKPARSFGRQGKLRFHFRAAEASKRFHSAGRRHPRWCGCE